MATGSSSDPRQWAATQLGVAVDASSGESRLVFLRRLREAEFTPPPEVERAWRILAAKESHDAPPPGQAEKEAERQALHHEIDDFCQRFFSTPIAERRQKWQELTARAGRFLRLAAQLQRLSPGLDLDPAAVPDEPTLVKQLALKTCELFVLQPQFKAEERQAFLRGISANAPALGKAARLLYDHHREFGNLEPEFIEELSCLKQTQQTVETRRGRVHKPRKLRPTRAVIGNNGAGWLAWLAIALVLGVVRLITLNTSSTNRSSIDGPLRFPIYTAPIYQPPFATPQYEANILERAGSLHKYEYEEDVKNRLAIRYGLNSREVEKYSAMWKERYDKLPPSAALRTPIPNTWSNTDGDTSLRERIIESWIQGFGLKAVTPSIGEESQNKKLP